MASTCRPSLARALYSLSHDLSDEERRALTASDPWVRLGAYVPGRHSPAEQGLLILRQSGPR